MSPEKSAKITVLATFLAMKLNIPPKVMSDYIEVLLKRRKKKKIINADYVIESNFRKAFRLVNDEENNTSYDLMNKKLFSEMKKNRI